MTDPDARGAELVADVQATLCAGLLVSFGVLYDRARRRGRYRIEQIGGSGAP